MQSVAQLGERYLRKVEVRGSIPLTSTISSREQQKALLSEGLCLSILKLSFSDQQDLGPS